MGGNNGKKRFIFFENQEQMITLKSLDGLNKALNVFKENLIAGSVSKKNISNCCMRIREFYDTIYEKINS